MKQAPIEPPLSTAVTYILLALADRDLHGYGIMQATLKASAGEYRIGPGTLYDNLRTLLAAGLVSEGNADDPAAETRRLYRLTEAGAGVLAAELKRLEQVVRAGRRRLAATPVRDVQ